MLVVAAGCSNPGKVATGTKVGTAPATTVTSSSSPITTSTTVARTVFAIGDKVKTPGGNYITVHVFQPVTASNSFSTPTPGTAYRGADIETCAGAQSTDANPLYYQVEMPDHTRLQIDFGVKDPALQGTTLAPGDCVRGWVVFDVPVGQKPSYLVFAPPVESTSIKWSLN
jgi:hypothetical protein